MYRLRKQFNFEAAHSLPLVPRDHPCFRVHGHSYSVVIEVGSEKLLDGFVIDFRKINEFAKPIVNEFDHQNLNDFVDNPTCENLCSLIAQRFCESFRSSYEDVEVYDTSGLVYLLAVEVSETPKTKCRLELREEL